MSGLEDGAGDGGGRLSALFPFAAGAVAGGAAAEGDAIDGVRGLRSSSPEGLEAADLSLDWEFDLAPALVPFAAAAVFLAAAKPGEQGATRSVNASRDGKKADLTVAKSK